MTETLKTSLEQLMSLKPGPEPMSFEGEAIAYGPIGLYGGHFLGQALGAGFQTVDEPKLASSFHAYFLKPGDPSLPLSYHVSVLRNGKRTDMRSITARQNGVDVFHMIASFKLTEEGDVHQKPMPEVSSAEELRKLRELEGEAQSPLPILEGGRLDIEMVSEGFREFDPEREGGLQVWLRKTGNALASRRDQQIVLAFLSDSTLMFNSVLPHGVPFQTHILTSLDHSVWYHNTQDPTDWVFFDQRSIAAADGRGLNEGEIYTSDGLLIMSCAQESMLRRMPSKS